MLPVIMIMEPFVTFTATHFPSPLKQVMRCHLVSVWRWPKASLKPREVASETVVIFAPDCVSQVSGLLPTKPTRVHPLD